jgi:hypothetical protein
MTETPKIDSAVEEKIDLKIEKAQLETGEIGASLDTAKALAAKTTEEEQRKASGQRLINGIWETTQAIIAISVSASVIYCDIHGIETDNLGKAFVLIIGIYFVRMNHIKVGGIGGTDSR